MIDFRARPASTDGTASGMKVGELAKRTGLSVRALHYYDEIGLLQPSKLTRSGHRVYDAPELLRLQQIKSLRQLGFSLEEIRNCLDEPAFSPKQVIAMHVARLRERIAEQTRLVALLEALGATFDAGEVARPDDLICAIESIALIDKSLSPEELAELKARAEQLGAARIRSVQAEWPSLIAKARAELRAGTHPADERMKPIARRWRELVREFTGGNPSIERKLRASYATEPKLGARSGFEPELFAFVNNAIRSLDA